MCLSPMPDVTSLLEAYSPYLSTDGSLLYCHCVEVHALYKTVHISLVYQWVWVLLLYTKGQNNIVNVQCLFTSPLTHQQTPKVSESR